MSDAFGGVKVLVTGARGFVGRHLCDALLKRGAEAVGLELRGPGDARVQIIEGDVGDPEDVARAFEGGGPEYVFHLAATATAGAAQRDPVAAFDTNVRGSYVVLDACRRAWDEGKGRLRGVVVAGSGRAYGAQQEAPLSEDLPLLALSPYDASKVCADVLTRSYAVTYGLPAAVARCANLYGPGDADLSRIVPDTITRILRGEAPRILSDGTPERDYLYIEDAVEGYLILAARAAEDGVRTEAFNLGTGRAVSVLHLVREMLDACERTDLAPVVLGEPTGETDRQHLSTKRAARRLGWRAQTPLDEGLRRTVAWYRA